MHPTDNLAPVATRRFTRLAAWCALLSYVGLASPLSLVVAVAIGALDGTHRVALRTGEETVQVVWQHRSSGEPRRYDLATQALTRFAPQEWEANPDHVLRFASSLAGSQELSPKISALTFPGTRVNTGQPVVVRQPVLREDRRTPEGTPAHFFRSTELLI